MTHKNKACSNDHEDGVTRHRRAPAGGSSLGGGGGCARVSEPIGNTGNSMIFQVCPE